MNTKCKHLYIKYKDKVEVEVEDEKRLYVWSKEQSGKEEQKLKEELKLANTEGKN